MQWTEPAGKLLVVREPARRRPATDRHCVIPSEQLGLPKRIYDRAYASVRFSGEKLDPLTVTLALRLPADHIHRDGEPRLRRVKSGQVKEYAPYHGGMWLMSSEKWVQSPRLSVHVDWLLKQLEPKADVIHSLLADGIDADFFCFSSGSTATPPSLPPDIRDRATALGIEIVIDHYGPSAAEQPTT
jgi:hypothetical protein